MKVLFWMIGAFVVSVGWYTGPRQMRLDPLRWVVPIPRAAVSCVVAFHHG